MKTKKEILILIICSISFLMTAQKYEWVKGIASNSSGKLVKTDKKGSVYTIGTYDGVTDFDPSVGTYTLAYNNVYPSTNIFIQKLDTNGVFKWAIGFNGSSGASVSNVTIDDNGDLYLIGDFKSVLGFNSSVNTNSLISNGGSDIYLQKFDSLGNNVWTKIIGGSDLDYGNGICYDGQGHLYLLATFSGTVDVDPGLGITNFITDQNYSNVLMEKLDLNGNLVWAKEIRGGGGIGGAGIGAPSAGQITVDSQSNIVLSGPFNGTVDFDPGIDTFNLVNNSYTLPNNYISKFDHSGILIWAKSFEGINGSYDYSTGLVLDNSDNVYVYGNFSGTIDFDPGMSVFNLISSGSGQDLFLSKLNSLGGFEWVKQIGSPTGNEYTNSLCADESGFVYFTGVFANTIDFDAGIGVANITPNTNGDSFICKYDSLGNYVWSNRLVGPAINGVNNTIFSVFVDSIGGLYFTGQYYGLTDFDPSAATHTLNLTAGSYHSFTTKWSQGLCSSFLVSIDTLSNINCSTLTGYASAHADYGQTPYAYAWGTSPVVNTATIALIAGGFIPVTVSDAAGCSQTRTIVVGSSVYLTDNDLNTFMVTNNFRIGFNTGLQIAVKNNGCLGSSGNLKLLLDTANLIFNYSVPAPNLIIADTLIWNFNTINYSTLALLYDVSVTTKTTSTLTDSISLKLMVNSNSYDVDLTNNNKGYLLPVLNSYDPNDIKVYPEGKCSSGYVLNNQLLTYTIRFQNTGNSQAINIDIIDTLDLDLDKSTLRILSSSHSVIPYLQPNNSIKFRFSNINLAAMSQNEPQSHGFVIFEIKPKSNVSIGAVIENQANIYFDYNEPINTNRVYNTIVSVIPNICNLVTELKDARSNNFVLYPNPSNGFLTLKTDQLLSELNIQISNIIGDIIFQKNVYNTNQTLFNFQGSAGVYFVKITDDKKNQTVFKIVKE